MSLLLQLATAAQELEADLNVHDGVDPDVHETPIVIKYPHTCTSYYGGLPYQDHNYGAPPPPTPPQSPPGRVRTLSPAVPKLNGHVDIEEASETVVTSGGGGTDAELMYDSITRCVCGLDHDDGFMICCDRCSVWQHIDCMIPDKNKIPEKDYFCERCQPRRVDKNRAIVVQTKKLQNKSDSSSDSELETVYAATESTPATVIVTSKKTKKIKKIQRLGEGALLNNKLVLKKKKRDRKKREGKMEIVESPFKRRRSQDSRIKVKITKIRRKSLLSDENANGAWPTSRGGHGVDRYEEACVNRYSQDVRIKLGGDTSIDSILEASQLLEQLCRVRRFRTGKGLEAEEDVQPNTRLIEYRGAICSRQQYEKDTNFYGRPHPYVLFYKSDDLDICIDATSYGNEARFVRRSCAPNAEVRHSLEGGELHIVIHSAVRIKKGCEITVPFDYDYNQCKYCVQCTCYHANCLVSIVNKKLDREKPKLVRRKRASLKSTDDPMPTLTSFSVLSETSNGPVSPVKKVTSPAGPITPIEPTPQSSVKMAPTPGEATPIEETSQIVKQLKMNAVSSGEENSSVQIANKSSEEATHSGGEDLSEDSKKMTREERKMDAIMKAFEKLEKREERRKEALARIEHTRRTGSVGTPVKTEGTPVKTDEVAFKREETGDQTGLQTQSMAATDDRKDIAKPKNRKVRRLSTPNRRRVRMSSGNSTETGHSGDENSLSNAGTPPGTPITAQDYQGGGFSKFFRFPNKKHLMNEWLDKKSDDLQRPLNIKTELGETDERTMFVKCVPSPHTASLDHLRRNSLSSSVNPSQKPALDTSLGSAKKRWLRQAMCENTSTSTLSTSISTSTAVCGEPAGGGPVSGNSSPASATHGATSPGATHSSHPSPSHSPPGDFITPLKKRRLARESAELLPTPVSAQSFFGSGSSEVNFQGIATASKMDPVASKNGFLSPPSVTPMTPLTPGENLFNKFPMGASRLEEIRQRDSIESDVSESIVGRRPTVDMVDPESPVRRPTLDTIDPEIPVRRPTVDNVDSESPVRRPTADTVGLKSPVRRPTADTVGTESPVRRPRVDTVDSESPVRRPTVDTVGPESPVRRPTMDTIDPVTSSSTNPADPCGQCVMDSEVVSSSDVVQNVGDAETPQSSLGGLMEEDGNRTNSEEIVPVVCSRSDGARQESDDDVTEVTDSSRTIKTDRSEDVGDVSSTKINGESSRTPAIVIEASVCPDAGLREAPPGVPNESARNEACVDSTLHGEATEHASNESPGKADPDISSSNTEPAIPTVVGQYTASSSDETASKSSRTKFKGQEDAVEADSSSVPPIQRRSRFSLIDAVVDTSSCIPTATNADVDVDSSDVTSSFTSESAGGANSEQQAAETTHSTADANTANSVPVQDSISSTSTSLNEPSWHSHLTVTGSNIGSSRPVQAYVPECVTSGDTRRRLPGAVTGEGGARLLWSELAAGGQEAACSSTGVQTWRGNHAVNGGEEANTENEDTVASSSDRNIQRSDPRLQVKDGTRTSPPTHTVGSPVTPQPVPPAKKRVSLLEYRQRLKDRSPSTSGDATSPPTTKVTTPTPGSNTVSQPGTLTPTLPPLFDTSGVLERRPSHKGVPDNSYRGREYDYSKKPSPEKKQARPGKEQLSLSERLKREFGLDSDEEDTGQGNGRETQATPPPPPPPAEGLQSGQVVPGSQAFKSDRHTYSQGIANGHASGTSSHAGQVRYQALGYQAAYQQHHTYTGQQYTPGTQAPVTPGTVFPNPTPFKGVLPAPQGSNYNAVPYNGIGQQFASSNSVTPQQFAPQESGFNTMDAGPYSQPAKGAPLSTHAGGQHKPSRSSKAGYRESLHNHGKSSWK